MQAFSRDATTSCFPKAQPTFKYFFIAQEECSAKNYFIFYKQTNTRIKQVLSYFIPVDMLPYNIRNRHRFRHSINVQETKRERQPSKENLNIHSISTCKQNKSKCMKTLFKLNNLQQVNSVVSL